MSSFVRDKDAHTRGVNAIAAVDGAGGRLRRIEARKAVRMASRDRALATMAARSFRPSLSGVGAMKTVANLPQLRFAGAPGTAPVSGSGGAHFGPNTAGGGSIVTNKTPVIGTLPPAASTPGTAADPSYGVSGGGGGSVGVMTGQTVATFTPADLDPGSALDPALDPSQTITDTSAVALPSTGLSANGKKYLIYAGVALAAYLLWKHSKKG